VFVLFLIVVAGLLLRLYRLDQAPIGALVDEMNFGYIAYSLLQTGADEHGNQWPLIFKAFGDYKLPAYGYLLIPFIKLLDLSLYVVRLPSVLVGTASIALTYVLAKNLGLSRRIRLLAAIVVAFSPWTFILSRFGFESNLGLFFWMGGLCFLTSLKEKSTLWHKLLTGCVIGLTWYAYIAYRPVTFVILLAYLVYLHFHENLYVKSIVLVFGAYFVTILPFLLPNSIAVNTMRFSQAGILSDQGVVMRINENRTFCSWHMPRYVCDIFWNKPITASNQLIGHFIKNYSAEFLATNGETDVPYLTVSGFGAFSYVLYPFFILGIVYVLFGVPNLGLDISNKHRLLILLGILVAVLPSTLMGAPQRVRLSVALPFFVMCIAIGFQLFKPLFKSFLGLFTQNDKIKYMLFTGICLGITVLYTFNSLQFYMDYQYVHSDKNDYLYYAYLHTLMPYLQRYESSHYIYIQPFFSDPIMYYAFFNKYDPKKYQNEAILDELEPSGFQHTKQLNKIIISKKNMDELACEVVASNQQALLVTNVTATKPFKPQKVILSASGATQQAYVFDLYQYGVTYIDTCKKISTIEMQAIKARLRNTHLK
jgi:4-amino-4-deoxy-L-arabinose transferase-like glycosyltransferase